MTDGACQLGSACCAYPDAGEGVLVAAALRARRQRVDPGGVPPAEHHVAHQQRLLEGGHGLVDRAPPLGLPALLEPLLAEQLPSVAPRNGKSPSSSGTMTLS